MDKIKVGIRIRPLIPSELDQHLPIQWSHKDKCIFQIDPKTNKTINNTYHFGEYYFL